MVYGNRWLLSKRAYGIMSPGMGTRNTHGFTIVETMLFLAVTGLLILGMLLGTGATLSVQRYRDATETFKALLQQQYADLRDVQNGRSVNWTCGASANPAQDAVKETPLGQGDCIFVGKYMRIDGGDIRVYRVLAYENDKTPRSNDIDAMRLNYTIAVSQSEVETRTMEWQTQIAWPKSGSGAHNPTTPRTMSLLFIRSPESGSLYTFTDDTIPSDPTDIPAASIGALITAGSGIPGQGERTLCINSGNAFAEGDRAVYIGKFASSASAIETKTNDFMMANGETPQC